MVPQSRILTSYQRTVSARVPKPPADSGHLTVGYRSVQEQAAHSQSSGLIIGQACGTFDIKTFKSRRFHLRYFQSVYFYTYSKCDGVFVYLKTRYNLILLNALRSYADPLLRVARRYQIYRDLSKSSYSIAELWPFSDARKLQLLP